MANHTIWKGASYYTKCLLPPILNYSSKGILSWILTTLRCKKYTLLSHMVSYEEQVEP